MSKKPFTPKTGEIYKGHGSGKYKCVSVNRKPYPELQNQESGWLFQASGIGIYEDGTIEWDWSKAGRFAEVA